MSMRGSAGMIDEEYQHLPLLQSPRIIIEEEEGEDDVFE